MAPTVDAAPISPLTPTSALAELALDELLLECVEAVEQPFMDEAGNVALLREVGRRQAEGTMPSAVAEQCIPVLKQACSVSWPGEQLDALRRQAASLRQALNPPPRHHIYHGTLASRLSGIAKDGLIPRRKPKQWYKAGVDEHAAQGVFFTLQWRQALSWQGASSYDSEGRQVRGAVVRVHSDGLPLENDLVATRSGAVVARVPVVPTGSAEVMLFPFTVGSPWLPIHEAVEQIKEKRRLARSYKSA